ncbi:MmcQ/YjbR family DNA-binding protein [Tenacibaculum sp.]|uniref:MmcQ/YjbR family DNA-binding protein n=1 Tax=Tenacibaculum sp. TaxID=1906242 RepID=UPI003D144BF7
MATFKTIEDLSLSLPKVTIEPHFKKTSFRIQKKIFLTFDQKNNRATVKLSEIDQNVFCLLDKKAIYPVDNKWGKQGWTFIEIEKINEKLLQDVITTAYCEVAPEKLASTVRPNSQ